MAEHRDETSSSAAPADGRVPDSRRRAILDDAVAAYVRHGYSVALASPHRAVVQRPQQVKVMLSLGLTLITGGVWLVILALRLLNRPVDRVVLTVDEWGVLVPEFS